MGDCHPKLPGDCLGHCRHRNPDALCRHVTGIEEELAARDVSARVSGKFGRQIHQREGTLPG
jgi:hypothetical protein